RGPRRCPRCQNTDLGPAPERIRRDHPDATARLDACVSQRASITGSCRSASNGVEPSQTPGAATCPMITAAKNGRCINMSSESHFEAGRLLGTAIADLGLTIEGTELEPVLALFEQE